MRKGFTLIELIVVIFMAGLLTTISAVSVFQVQQKRQTKAVAKQVKNVIMEAHAYAVSPKTDITDSAQVDIIVTDHTIGARIGNTDIVGPVKVSRKVTLTCLQPVEATGLCFYFKRGNESGTFNALGQTFDDLPHDIRAKSSTDERYTITTSPKSGNVTITTP